MGENVQVVLKNNFDTLVNYTNCDDTLIIKCIANDVITKDESYGIEDAGSNPIKRSKKFYDILWYKDNEKIEVLLTIFKEIAANKRLIEILSKCCSNPTQIEELPGVYRLEGTETAMKDFDTGISYETFHKIKLSYVSVNAKELVNALANCNNLKELILEQISLTGKFGNIQARLPNLATYVIDLIPPAKDLVTSLLAPETDSDADTEGFKSILVFVAGEPEEILSSGINIEFSVGSLKNLVVNPEEGFVSSRLEFSQQILTRSFPLKKLSLKNCTIDFIVANADCKFECLEILNLNSVVVEPNLASCLHQCKNLTCLSLWENPQNITIQLSDLPSKLTQLKIARVNIEYSEGVTFPNFEFIYLDYCHLDDRILDNFSTIFNSRHVSINPFGPSQMHPLLKNVSENPRTAWIRIFIRRCFNPSNGENEPRDYHQVERFLRNLNLYKFKNCDRFILKRNGNGKGWSTKRINEYERDQCYFHFYGGLDFWKSFDDYYRK